MNQLINGSIRNLENEIENTIIEATIFETDPVILVNILIDNRDFKKYLFENVGNEFDIKHYIENLCDRLEIKL